MNELFFNWRKSLNIKKVIITSAIIITLILFTFIFFLTMPKEIKNKNTTETSIYHPETNSTTFFDKNHSISVELSNIYGLEQYTSAKDYLIELRSDTNLNIFISFLQNIEGKTLKDVIEADKLAYTEEFGTTSNISELKEIVINKHTAYTYSFHYLDQSLNTSFYIQVIWLQINENYYIFDIEFPLNDLQTYTNLIPIFLSSLKIL